MSRLSIRSYPAVALAGTLAGAVSVAALSGTAIAQARYSVTDLGTLSKSATASSAGLSVNNLANTPVPSSQLLAVGWSTGETTTAQVPFVWSRRGGMLPALGNVAATGQSNDVNSAGWYCGSVVTRTSASRTPQAFLASTLSAAPVFLAGLTPASASSANALNETRVVVGTSTDRLGNPRPVFWSTASRTPIMIGTLGGPTGEALGVNNQLWIVGGSDNAAAVRRAFVTVPLNTAPGAPGRPVDLGSLVRNGFSTARDVNSNGQIVGMSQFAGSDVTTRVTRAVLWTYRAAPTPVPPTITNLGTLANTDRSSDALGLNARGQVVGWSGVPFNTTPTPGATRAFLWQSGTMTDLNSLIDRNSGWQIVSAAEINDTGHIVGIGLMRDANSTRPMVRAVLLTPVR
jgi:probable HAF family extracellular repeat protein